MRRLRWGNASDASDAAESTSLRRRVAASEASLKMLARPTPGYIADFHPQNILVIDFGQLGDVVLSLPALKAIRERFPYSKITVAAGTPAHEIVLLSGYSDDVLPVNRVALKYGNKLVAGFRIIKLVREVRRRRFDLVIDLHSLSETNLLMWVSGARYRLGARRTGRSLDFLFTIKAPLEDPHKHAVDRYLDVLAPLGVTDPDRQLKLATRPADSEKIERLLKASGYREGELVVGLNPGSAYPPRRWPKERFIELGSRLAVNFNARVCVFGGPEEGDLAREVASLLPGRRGIALDRLNIPELAAAIARCAVFVTNDTGPMHIAVAVGAPVVALMNRPAASPFDPFGQGHKVLRGPNILAISTDEVYEATCSLLGKSRTSALFER